MAPTQDATSGIYIPQTAAEWTGFIAGVPVPQGLFRMQELASPAQDYIGPFTLYSSAAPNNASFDKTLPGWTSVGVGFGNNKPSNIETTNAGLPDLSGATAASSFAVLGYYDIIYTTTTVKHFLEAANGTLAIAFDSSNHVGVISGVNSAFGLQNAYSGSFLADGALVAFIVVNKTLGTVKLYTQQEIISVTPGIFDATKNFLYGGLVVNAGDVYVPYGALWTGADAEFTDQTAFALLSGLNFQMAWSASDALAQGTSSANATAAIPGTVTLLSSSGDALKYLWEGGSGANSIVRSRTEMLSDLLGNGPSALRELLQRTTSDAAWAALQTSQLVSVHTNVLTSTNFTGVTANLGTIAGVNGLQMAGADGNVASAIIEVRLNHSMIN